ncbi:MAG: hypothetical protein IPL53_19170 [Ignavibacteria bacterium]|nr:hypothetical protein [Ignavibacteria bacterium]
MVSRNKRDAKFLIFQSLYIIAIAILFYKGTDLSLTPVKNAGDTDTVIAKTLLPAPPDTSEIRIKKTILDSLSKNNRFVDNDEIVVKTTYLDELKAGQKRQTTESKTEKQEGTSHKTTIEGETPK